MAAIASIGGSRKYTPVWKKIKLENRCEVETTHADTITIINGVKKEKVMDKNRPKNKLLDIQTEEIPNSVAGKPSKIKIIFRLVEDTSINNL